MAKKGNKGRKVGRNGRAPSNKTQAFRSEANKKRRIARHKKAVEWGARKWNRFHGTKSRTPRGAARAMRRRRQFTISTATVESTAQLNSLAA